MIRKDVNVSDLYYGLLEKFRIQKVPHKCLKSEIQKPRSHRETIEMKGKTGQELIVGSCPGIVPAFYARVSGR